MYEKYFTEEHHLFREGFRSFLQQEVVPFIDKWEDSGSIDRFIWKKFGDMGYFGLDYPEAYGGLNLDKFYTVIWLEEMQRIHSGGFAAAMWAHAFLAMQHLNAEGDERIKQKYLAPSIAGEKIGCLCITEPFAGSDVSGMKTTAIKDGNHYVINGSKTFITNGVYSDYLIVSAKTNPSERSKGISILLVDRDTEGLSASKLDKLGWRASDTAEIAFDNVRIPVENLMGEADRGFYYLMQHLALERIIMASNAHARAEYAIEYTMKYMSERVAFGKPIIEFQVLRHRLVELATEIEHIKCFNYSVIDQIEKGNYPVKEASMAKLQSTKVADKVMYECLQMMGGYGYMEGYPLARMFRDSRLGPIGGGTSEIMKEVLSKMIINKVEYKPSL